MIKSLYLHEFKDTKGKLAFAKPENSANLNKITRNPCSILNSHLIGQTTN